MKTIKELFELFWKKEWNKLEGGINQFAFKFYKEGYEQNKKDILRLIDKMGSMNGWIKKEELKARING